MHHQVTIVPGLEGESASQPAQCPAFFVASIESSDNHISTLECGWRDASRASEKSEMRAMQIGGRQTRGARACDVGHLHWIVQVGRTAIEKVTCCGSQSRNRTENRPSTNSLILTVIVTKPAVIKPFS